MGMKKSRKDSVRDYFDRSIPLDHNFSSFRIVELTDQYAKLDSRTLNIPNGLELTIHFKPKDDEDKYDHPHLREELQKVYNWHMKNCDDCKSGKDKPPVSYEIVLEAPLRELVGVPYEHVVRESCETCSLPEELDLTKLAKDSPKYKFENVAGDWFWQDS